MWLPVLEGKARESQGRRDGAFEMYAVALRFGGHLGQDPYLTYGMSAGRCNRIALRAVEHWLWSAAPDEAMLAQVQRRLHELAQGRPRWERVIASELLAFDELVAALKRDPDHFDSYVFDDWGSWEKVREYLLHIPLGQAMLHCNSLWLREQLVGRFDLPLAEYLQTQPAFKKRVSKTMPWLSPARLVADLTDVTWCRGFYGRDALYWTVLDAQFALVRYKAAHGEYPERLDEAKDLMLSDGIDPFSGERLRYRREDDGSFAFWSVGEDLRDDGGKREEGKSRWQSADYIWSSAAIDGEE